MLKLSFLLTGDVTNAAIFPKNFDRYHRAVKSNLFLGFWVFFSHKLDKLLKSTEIFFYHENNL